MIIPWEEYDTLENSVLLGQDSTKLSNKIVGRNGDLILELIKGNVMQYDIFYANDFIGHIVFSFGVNTLLIQFINIEEEHRRKHYAKDALTLLLEHYKAESLIGHLLVQSIPFWNNMGANIDSEYYKIYDDNYFLPFKIDIRK